jgi:hypothetical protein
MIAAAVAAAAAVRSVIVACALIDYHIDFHKLLVMCMIEATAAALLSPAANRVCSSSERERSFMSDSSCGSCPLDVVHEIYYKRLQQNATLLITTTPILRTAACSCCYLACYCLCCISEVLITQVLPAATTNL